ncbi:MAG: Uma2 family endonuclease [Methylothermaceae bacterium]|nr:Uma2 family endonuclease [Methylothermaceae bacterium]
MPTLQKNVTITPEEYLEGEKYSEVKHEYVNGRIYAMMCVSRPHSLITGNLHAALHGHLRGTPCRVFMADMKVRKDNVFYYPDLTVTCHETRRHEYYVEEPVLAVEVLSPSTEGRDRLDKRLLYQSIPTLEEYVLIAQDKVALEIYRRAEAGGDRITYGPTETVHLASVGWECAIQTIYEGVWD